MPALLVVAHTTIALTLIPIDSSSCRVDPASNAYTKFEYTPGGAGAQGSAASDGSGSALLAAALPAPAHAFACSPDPCTPRRTQCNQPHVLYIDFMINHTRSVSVGNRAGSGRETLNHVVV